MATKLTDSICSKAQPGAKVADLADSQFRGLLLRINPGGSKVWYYRWQRGRMIKLGTFPEMNTFDARRIAKDKMIEAAGGADLVEAKRERQRPQAQGMTFAEFVAEQYLPEAKVRMTKKGFEGYRCRLNRDLLPLLGDKPLKAIDLQTIEKWRTKRRAEGKKNGYIDASVIVLRSVIKLAIDRKELDADPLKGIKPLPVDNSHVRYLDDDERQRLHVALDGLPSGDNMRCGVILSLNTGMRAHELFNLQWADLDLQTSMVKVQAIHSKSGKARWIPLNDAAMTAIGELRRKESGPYLLHLDGGRPYTCTKFRPFNNFMKKAGINHFRWHDFRHDFASRLVQSGVDLNTVRELLGHSDLKMTLRYAHLAPHNARRAVDLLAGAAQSGKVVSIGSRMGKSA
jgi:integrase